MKKFLLIIGIILIVVGILSLIWAGINCFAFYNTLDGSNSLYDRLHQRMISSLIVGIVTLLAGILCTVIQAKLFK